MANEGRSEISERHGGEWETFRKTALSPLLDDPTLADEKSVKTMKQIAETLRIAQDGERRACEFGEGARVGDAPLQFAWEDGSDASDQDSL